MAAHIFILCALTAVGLLACGLVEEMAQRKDPPIIVIDEVCGMLLGLLFLPYDIKLIILAFIIFRVLDTLKPWPIGKIEKLKGSLGIMGDDIVAGIYTNIILQVVVRFTTFKGS